MATVYYLSDANITDRLTKSLTDTDIETVTARNNICRLPATAIIDGMVPDQAPFADIAAATPTPTIINQAAAAYAVAIAYRIINNNAEDPQAKAWDKIGDRIMQVDDKGKSQLVLAGNYKAFAIVDLTRDRVLEAADEADISD